jgi:hypothetical protein
MQRIRARHNNVRCKQHEDLEARHSEQGGGFGGQVLTLTEQNRGDSYLPARTFREQVMLPSGEVAC